MPSKIDVYDFIKIKKKCSFIDIAKHFDIHPSKNKKLSYLLNELRDENKISYSKKDDLFFISKFIGEFETIYNINMKNNGFCFIEMEDKNSIRVAIFKSDLHPLKNDEIIIDVFYNEIDDYYYGKIKKIRKRSNQFIYAQVDENLEIKPLYFNQKINLDYSYDGLVKNAFVKFRIKEYYSDRLVLELVKTINNIDNPYSDIEVVLDYGNISTNFPEQVINESNLIPDEVSNINEFNRKDLTDQMIFTIDGEKTKDFDDAISVVKKDNGNYILGVHIADVAYYVKEDSELDIEARKRGTSIYLIEKVVPMLPEKLSNGICSLNPNVKRFTLTLEAEIDNIGNILNSKIYPSMIESKYRLTYNQVANMENEELIKNDKVLYQTLKNAYELSSIISKNKYNDGYIDFEIEEPIIEVNKKTGKPIAIKNRKRLSSEILIENFMVFANETVSKTIADMKIPSIYRIHENPSEEKIENLKTFLKVINLDVKVKNSKDPKEFQKMVEQLKEKRFDNLVKMALLRTMQKAKYSIDNIGHFGLASKYYSHFTSPIRRYPDLLLHRIIWEVIIKGNNDYSNKHIQEINKIANISTDAEIKAVDIERKINDIKKAEFYSSMINEIKSGTIASIQKFGIFVEFEDLTSTLVHISSIAPDNEFEISNDFCYLTVKNKIYKIGDKVKVKIISTNKMEGKIDSILVEKL